MSDWISVEDQEPPKNGEKFIVYDDRFGYVPWIYWDDDWVSELIQWSGKFDYWMPFPAAAPF